MRLRQIRRAARVPTPERLWRGQERRTESAGGAPEQEGKAMDEASGKLAELDDFQVIAERLRVMDTIAALTDRYRKLNEEMSRRPALSWMLP